MSTADEIELVAQAIWKARRARAARDMPALPLEEWGDGSVPRACGIFEEAKAALEAVRSYHA